jgi:hypothetical protein
VNFISHPLELSLLPSFSTTVSFFFFSHFAPATAEDVRTVVLSFRNSYCSLDFIPTFLFKSCLCALIQVITTIINLSLSEGIFPDNFKHAIITPLHKKHYLPQVYWSDTALFLISTSSEVHLKLRSLSASFTLVSLINYSIQSFPSLSRFQSTYHKLYSTETALTRIYKSSLYL